MTLRAGVLAAAVGSVASVHAEADAHTHPSNHPPVVVGFNCNSDTIL